MGRLAGRHLPAGGGAGASPLRPRAIASARRRGPPARAGWAAPARHRRGVQRRRRRLLGFDRLGAPGRAAPLRQIIAGLGRCLSLFPPPIPAPSAPPVGAHLAAWKRTRRASATTRGKRGPPPPAP